MFANDEIGETEMAENGKNARIMDHMLGERLRQARIDQQMSLADVAVKADISAATLSRIERDKQTLDLGLFLTLVRILKGTPAEFFGNEGLEEGADVHDPLIARIASMRSAERTALWRELSEKMRERRSDGRTTIRNLSQQVDELAAQAEYLRGEIVAMQARIKR